MYVDPSAVTLPIAILAGLISFISPCVLPLVPAYIGYLTGQAANTASSSLAAEESAETASPSRWTVFLHGVFFVIGFSLIFVLVIGIGAGVIGQLGIKFIQISKWVMLVGGILIIILGLHTMGVFRIPFLYYDTRKQAKPRPELGYMGSLYMGITFAAGWAPCTGPILAAMFTLGASTGSVGRAVLLLTAYSLGLGIPFLLTALLLDRATGLLRGLKKYMRVIEIASGLLMIVIGVVVATGWLQRLLGPLAAGSDLSLKLDEWLVRLIGSGE